MFPIHSERLTLRAFTEFDLSAFANYRKDPEVARYQSWENYTFEDALAFFHGQEGLVFDTPGTWFQVAICEDEKIVGDLGIHFFEDNQIEIGFTLSRSAQKKGFARESLRAMIDVLFGKLKKHRIVANIDTRNENAKKLLESLAFRQEGHFLKNVFFKGEWSDEYRYALLGEETNL